MLDKGARLRPFIKDFALAFVDAAAAVHGSHHQDIGLGGVIGKVWNRSCRS
jgi:hypothetical protein